MTMTSSVILSPPGRPSFWLPPLAGVTARSLDVDGLELILRQVILDFEPRILRNSLRCASFTEERMSHNA